MSFVVDTSVSMAWCFEDEANSFTEAVLDRLGEEEAVVPAIWTLEVANVLLVGERRGRLTQAQSVRFVQLLHALPIEVDSEASKGMSAEVLAIGRWYSLSAYDAAYLELAARLGVPLATQDTRLGQAAERMGIPRLS
ncbi:MAG: type II toxin-antitoxin system VapC family toxin [Chloroflexi bacterium]|nr:type II toxin-antitoxin system VapC family toxin [Chloroflexota bacterium]